MFLRETMGEHQNDHGKGTVYVVKERAAPTRQEEQGSDDGLHTQAYLGRRQRPPEDATWMFVAYPRQRTHRGERQEQRTKGQPEISMDRGQGSRSLDESAR